MKKIQFLIVFIVSLCLFSSAHAQGVPTNHWWIFGRSNQTSRPIPPSALAAAPASSSQINLTWTDNSSNETGFVIESATYPEGDYSVVTTTAANATSYSNTSLNPATSYVYRIKATNSGVTSYYSAEAIATTNAPSAPTAPSSLSANAISVSQIDLAWTDNASTETGFEIARSLTTSTGFTVIDTAAVDATTYSSTGLSSSTTYYYKVRAINAFGASSYTSEANATTSTPALTPTAPSALTAENGSATAINLAWTDNSSNETGFEVHRSTSSGGVFTLVHTTAANVVTYQNTGLTTGTTYYYKVRAVNGIGNSAFTSEASATPNLPLAPSGLTVTLNTNPTSTTGGGTISWTDNSSNETGFEIERSTDSNTSFALITTTAANATSYNETGLNEGRRYYYRVRAVNGAVASAYSSQANDLTTWSTPIAVANTGTAVASVATTISVGLPTSPAPVAGQMMVILIASKTQQVRALPPVGGGWAEGVFMLDNTNGNATDAGPVSMTIFYKIAGASETTPVVFDVLNTNSVAYGKSLVFSGDANAFWSVDFSGGAHNTLTTTAYSAISWEKMALSKGDAIATASAVNTDGITFSTQSLSHTTATFTPTLFTGLPEIFESATNSGNDVSMNASLFTVNNNGSVTANKATFTMLGSTSTAAAPVGVTGFIRLRNARSTSSSVTTPAVRTWRAADIVDVVAGGDGSTFGDGLRVNSFGSDPGTTKYSISTFNGRPCIKVVVDFSTAGTDATVNYRSELHTNPWLPNYPLGTQLIMEWKFETDATATQSTTDWLPFQLHPGTPPGSGFTSNSPQLSLAFTFAGQTGFDNAPGAATAGQLSFINFVDDPTIENTTESTKQYIRNRYTGYDWAANSVYRIRLHFRADVITGQPVFKLWASKNGGAMTLLYEDYSYPTAYLTTAEAGSTALVMGTPKFGVYHHGVKTETARAAHVAAGHSGITMYIPCMKQIIMLPGDANYFTDYTNNSATIYDLVDTSTE